MTSDSTTPGADPNGTGWNGTRWRSQSRGTAWESQEPCNEPAPTRASTRLLPMNLSPSGATHANPDRFDHMGWRPDDGPGRLGDPAVCGAVRGSGRLGSVASGAVDWWSAGHAPCIRGKP